MQYAPGPAYIPYGRKFWRGIYFGGLAVLRGIRQYFIRQNLIAAQCDVIIIAKSYQCVYTRPAARRASLIVGLEFTIKSCVRGHHFFKEFCTPEVGEELACLSRRRRRSKRRVRGPVKTDGTKIVQSKRNSDLLSFQLYFISNFVLTEPKLTHGPIKIPARLSSHFVMNIIIAKPWLNRQSKFRQMTYFQQSAKISSRQNFRPYGSRDRVPIAIIII